MTFRLDSDIECLKQGAYFSGDDFISQSINDGSFITKKEYFKDIKEQSYFPNVVDGTGKCSKYPNHFNAWLDYADTGVRVNKQSGDKLRLNIYSEQDTKVNIEYDTAYFEGSCPRGEFSVSTGTNECYLTVKSAESIPAESIHYDVEKEITIENKVEKVSIINSPAFLIITDSEKLSQRFPNE